MELRPIKIKTKCDNGACRNMADFVVYREDTMSSQSLRLCKPCLLALGEMSNSLLTKVSTPKKSTKATQNSGSKE